MSETPLNASASTELHDAAEVGRIHHSFHFPVVKHPTGRVQFRKDGAEVVTIDRLGDVHRAQVVTIMPAGKEPTAKALDFCRGLVVTGNFSHVAADTPLGQPDEFKPKKPGADAPSEVLATEETRTDDAEAGERIGDFEPPRGDDATLSDMDAANREHLETFDGSPESVKKPRK